MTNLKQISQMTMREILDEMIHAIAHDDALPSTHEWVMRLYPEIVWG
jgi:hypothetical protein